jgi:heavy metal sensor kinase
MALTVTSAVSAILCYAYFIGIDAMDNGSPWAAYKQQFKLVLVGLFLLHLGTIIVLFRRIATRCLQPLRQLTQKCSEINIHTLDLRLPTPNGDCVEAQNFVTACNSMLERLESGAKRMRQFSGDASHELRTPLTILRGETEVALRWAKDTDEFRTAMMSNMEEINRMGRIIEDLLTLAKSESGELPLSIKRLSFSDLLQELYMQGCALANPKNIQVDLIHSADSEIIIYGDDLRLRQLFLNLLTNAIHYTKENGSVIIEAERTEQHVIVKIKDTGIGISTEHLSHIFERFYRTDEDRNRSTGGTGLGLAIVKWVVETHAGSIDVESTPGVGSTFTVTLPIDGPPSAQLP